MHSQWMAVTLPDLPGKLLSVWLEDGRIMQLHVCETDDTGLLNAMYIGKIKNLAPQIGAAFVEIGDGWLCHVPLDTLKYAIYINRTGERKDPRPGDELLIQVNREAQKTKLPGGTGRLSLTGTSLVLTPGKCMLGLSSKLSAEERTRFKEALSDLVTEEYGFIVRTNAAQANLEDIREEAAALAERYAVLVTEAESRTCFSCVYRPVQGCMPDLQGTNLGKLDEVVTDDAAVYAQAKDFLGSQRAGQKIRLRLYEDAQLPLYKLIGLESALKEALRERVWLKSGGYLVIQPTEALTVIDVNTGKYAGHKKAQETFFKIDLEAAAEAARQMRLRNLSGIILIDFIDLESEEHRQRLATSLRAHLKADPVRADFVDFTRLGLAEITRKKILRPLREQLKKDGVYGDTAEPAHLG